MYDIIEKYGKSTIQHGDYNNRIYLMKLAIEDYPEILTKMNNLALERSYTKIFAIVPFWLTEEFESQGYLKEAEIPKYYYGNEKVCLLSKFLDNDRATLSKEDSQKIELNLKLAEQKKNDVIILKNDPSFSLRELKEVDISNLAKLYSKIFKSYPFPIFEKNYLRNAMEKNVVFFGIYHGDKLIAASSAEMNAELKNVEMTDFATDSEYAGNNLSLILLRKMETEMVKKGIKTAFTIARSFSAGMNITFAKQGYEYSGTLVNNTNISGKIESMNVWYKDLMI